MNKLLLYPLLVSLFVQACQAFSQNNTAIQKFDGIHQSKNSKACNGARENEYFTIYDDEVNHVLHILHDAHTHDESSHPQLLNNQRILKVFESANGSTHSLIDVGFWMSKLAVHAVAQVSYALIAGAMALVYPPAAPIVYCSLQFTFAALVEIASNMIASGISIALNSIFFA